MIIASIGWSVQSLDKMEPETRDVFVKNWPGLAQVIKKKKEIYKSEEKKDEWLKTGRYEFGERQRITMEEAVALQGAGIEISLEAIDGTMLTKMVGRPDKYGNITPLELQSGQVVQIAVPDIGLLQIDEVTWMEDACTEELQARLEDGWRILAVCPPNAQRRPDYILGRKRK